MDTWVGLDLGQLVDPSAAVALRRTFAVDRHGRIERTIRGHALYRYDVAAVRQYPLGTSYPAIVQHIIGQLRRPEFGRRPKLVIDGTGVGVAVVDMFRRALRPLGDAVACYDISITAGRAATQTGKYSWHVAKLQIAGAIREALDSGRLKISREVDPAGLLKRELQDFKVTITVAGNETFTARSGAHDDIVLATALPIWLAGHPRMEMATDAADPDAAFRPREQAAIALAEAEEREALAMERGEMTPARAARIAAARALARANPLDDRLWGWSDQSDEPC